MYRLSRVLTKIQYVNMKISLKKCHFGFKEPKALWTNLHQLFETQLSFSTAYHPQTDGLAQRMIQTLEDMVRRFCAYGLEFKDCDVFTNDWYNLLPELELA
ncbi:hypothetical protein O181_121809 [Austropuccinia psidii MF-1]|uniref:Integrase catalytic domain-containing protein n=1 Tax=Austropuccinia psidii MF-1 TaxID=1389203 RepID=A0A9Q3Q1Q8_9BASI|nr:hypothetical protein [Austropuccinia psidii MF-1]